MISRNALSGAAAHPCSDRALQIPTFPGMTAPALVRHSRESGNNSPHGVYPKALFRHSRESGNPLNLLLHFPKYAQTELGWAAAGLRGWATMAKHR